MSPADITALRGLLAEVAAAGWCHHVYGLRHHGWHRTGQTISLALGRLDIFIDGTWEPIWTVPAQSVGQLRTVLELAGALAPAARPAPAGAAA